ncbi:MAG: hypothetical protein EA422_04450 [Gemmatimonadales bacterium]|nr:MAG: hypothetical protein EA422_04450 [Gemmatimonadales bacterium]
MLGGGLPILGRALPHGHQARLMALDACLGVPGLPQSGTGQISLLTGVNAPRRFGAHFGPWPPVRLRGLLERENLLSRAVGAGVASIFANAYPMGYPDGRHPRRVAAPPLAARAAGLLSRHQDELIRGEAVASEIINAGWREHLGFRTVPEVTPRRAGRTLARLANGARLTFFAHYLTDLAGHRGGMLGSVAALERVDAFLGGILDDLGRDVTLVMVSDHGNVEDVRGGHTRNPALGLTWGPEGEGLAATCQRLTDVAPRLLHLLDVPPSHPPAHEPGSPFVHDASSMHDARSTHDAGSAAGKEAPGSGDPG